MGLNGIHATPPPVPMAVPVRRPHLQGVFLPTAPLNLFS